MEGRKLDTSLSANNAVAMKRVQFDRHLNECQDCRPGMCHQAETLWRAVCLTALRTQAPAASASRPAHPIEQPKAGA